ncbi:CD48 antigen-like isoform X2 [Rhinoraja longicauda]
MGQLTCLVHAAVFAVFAVSPARTGADPRPMIRTVGQNISLPTGMAVGPQVSEVVWKRLPNMRITEYEDNIIVYFGSTEYKQRVTFNLRTYELEVRDLQVDDTADYEVIFVTRSGSESSARVRLDVYEPISGTLIKARNITEICNFYLTCVVTVGNPTRFVWRRNGKPLQKNSFQYHHVRNETVEIHHSGAVVGIVYTCEASNPISTDKAEIQLEDICEGPGLPWWVIILIAIGGLIGITVVIVIVYGCMLSAANLTWAEVREAWVNWCQEDPKSRASPCILLCNPKSVITPVENNSNEMLEIL